MSDKTHTYMAWGTMHLTFFFVTLATAIVGFIAASNQYSAHQTVDVILAMAMMFLAALNLVFFVLRITQMVDETLHPEPEIDDELEEVYDQLDADGFIFDGDEIIRYEDDGRLYLCLDNDGATSIDLLLAKSGDGCWQLYVPGNEKIPVPMEHVDALRKRVRQQDEQITSEIKGLSS